MSGYRHSGLSQEEYERREFLRAVAVELAAQGNAAMEAADAEGGRTTPSDPKYDKATVFYSAARYLAPDVTT